MDPVTIMVSAISSALLFLLLEFTIILPLFIKVVKKATIDAVNTELIPSVTTFIDGKVDSLKTELGDTILARIRGMFGGRSKGVNRVMERLANGESLEEIEDDYAEGTIDRVLDIVSAVADRLPVPSGAKENGSKKEKDNQESGTPSQGLQLLQESTPQA